MTYKCPYCKAENVSSDKEHERACYFNPENRSCLSCSYRKKEKGRVRFECTQSKISENMIVLTKNCEHWGAFAFRNDDSPGFL